MERERKDVLIINKYVPMSIITGFKTMEDVTDTLQVMENIGWIWHNGERPMKSYRWEEYFEEYQIKWWFYLSNKNRFSYWSVNWARRWGKQISFKTFISNNTPMKKLPREVYVSDYGVRNASASECKRILIAELPWKTNYKYVCVDGDDKERFNSWEEYSTSSWKYIAEIPEEQIVETICIGSTKYDKKEFEKAVSHLKSIY